MKTSNKIFLQKKIILILLCSVMLLASVIGISSMFANNNNVVYANNSSTELVVNPIAMQPGGALRLPKEEGEYKDVKGIRFQMYIDKVAYDNYVTQHGEAPTLGMYIVRSSDITGNKNLTSPAGVAAFSESELKGAVGKITADKFLLASSEKVTKNGVTFSGKELDNIYVLRVAVNIKPADYGTNFTANGFINLGEGNVYGTPVTSNIAKIATYAVEDYDNGSLAKNFLEECIDAVVTEDTFYFDLPAETTINAYSCVAQTEMPELVVPAEDMNVVYESTNPAVATVVDGQLNLIATGTSTIKAKIYDHVTSFDLNVVVGHEVVAVDGTAPTYFATGLEAYSYCKHCGQKFNTLGEEIDQQVILPKNSTPDITMEYMASNMLWLKGNNIQADNTMQDKTQDIINGDSFKSINAEVVNVSDIPVSLTGDYTDSKALAIEYKGYGMYAINNPYTLANYNTLLTEGYNTVTFKAVQSDTDLSNGTTTIYFGNNGYYDLMTGWDTYNTNKGATDPLRVNANEWKTFTVSLEDFIAGIKIDDGSAVQDIARIFFGNAANTTDPLYFGDIKFTHEHDYEYHEAVEATESSDGNDAYYTCKEGCGKYFNAEYEEVEQDSLFYPAHVLEWVELVESDYENSGMRGHYTCSTGCGKYFDADKNEVKYEDLIIPAIPRNNIVVSQGNIDVYSAENTTTENNKAFVANADFTTEGLVAGDYTGNAVKFTGNGNKAVYFKNVYSLAQLEDLKANFDTVSVWVYSTTSHLSSQHTTADMSTVLLKQMTWDGQESGWATSNVFWGNSNTYKNIGVWTKYSIALKDYITFLSDGQGGVKEQAVLLYTNHGYATNSIYVGDMLFIDSRVPLEQLPQNNIVVASDNIDLYKGNVTGSYVANADFTTEGLAEGAYTGNAVKFLGNSTKPIYFTNMYTKEQLETLKTLYNYDTVSVWIYTTDKHTSSLHMDESLISSVLLKQMTWDGQPSTWHTNNIFWPQNGANIGKWVKYSMSFDDYVAFLDDGEGGVLKEAMLVYTNCGVPVGGISTYVGDLIFSKTELPINNIVVSEETAKLYVGAVKALEDTKTYLANSGLAAEATSKAPATGANFYANLADGTYTGNAVRIKTVQVNAVNFKNMYTLEQLQALKTDYGYNQVSLWLYSAGQHLGSVDPDHDKYGANLIQSMTFEGAPSTWATTNKLFVNGNGNIGKWVKYTMSFDDYLAFLSDGNGGVKEEAVLFHSDGAYDMYIGDMVFENTNA